MVTCLLLSYQNLAKLTLTATDSEAQFAGQDCQFILRLIHAKHHAQDLTFCFQKGQSKLTSIVNDDSVYLYATSKNRGYFNPGRITLRSSFPFGLYNVWTHLDFDYQLLLYPQPLENTLQDLSSSEHNVAHSMGKSRLGVDQFSTLKSYQPGESLKSVAWKQVAQGRGWLTKQFEQFSGGDHVLDISRLNHLALETRLSFLCYHIIELEKKGLRYALILPNQKIEMGLGSVHKKRCLTALALFERVKNQS
ncbi:hypothetical protein GCM10007916_26000 [Psychromonas marina]|uniref:DUF58 domain-containing protein n=2 Tax=Psychromonas marina TaxID=88364 RepID=A0ABQ6E3F4_9GAMM|nr:hypothetical protein GCM10007916_26000 [Psychromonas marina]